MLRGITTGYKGLLVVTRGHRELQIFTTGYKRLEGILRSFKGWEVVGVIGGYREL